MSGAVERFLASLRNTTGVYDTEDVGARHATWLELFFDLVFIVAVAELGRLLREDLSGVGLLEYASLFVLVWWIWVGFSYYADVFDTEDLFSRLSLLLVMFGVLVLSQTIGVALHGGSLAFAAALLFLRTLYIGLALRGWYVVEGSDKFFTYWVTFSSLSTLVWAGSLFVPDPGRYGLWISAFMLEIAGIGIVYLVFDRVPVQVSHFPERLGLFTILVLGETILAVAIGVEGADLLGLPAITAVGGFLVAVAVWWLYFNNFDERTIDHALGETAPHWLQMRERMLVYVFGHLFIFTGIGATGVGIEATIEASIAGHGLEDGARLVFSSGLAAFLVGSSICHRAVPTPLHDHLFAARLGTAVLVLAAAGLVGHAAPIFVVWLLALLLVGLAALEGVHRYSRSDRTTARAGPTR